MKTYTIKKINTDEFTYIVYSLSYITPFGSLSQLQADLKKKNFVGNVLFDMLASSGMNNDRFKSTHFDGESLDLKSIQTVSNIPNEIKKDSNIFYQKNLNKLPQFSLTKEENFIIQQGIFA